MKSLAIANHCGFLLGFIPSCFEGKLIAKIMTSRSTHTSQAAEFHAMNSAAVIEILAVNSSLPTTSSSEPLATSQSLTLDQLSPAFLASIVTAVKQALAAEQLQAANLPATPAASFAKGRRAWGCSWFLFVFWPARCPSFSSGSLWRWFSSVTSPVTTSTTQRRPDFVVPAFVSTFAPLIPAVTSSTNTAAVTPLSLSGISSLVQTPILHQLFVVSPGFSPVPAKLVSQVMAGKFVELNELLSANLVLNEPRASIAVLVLTPTPENLKWWVDDITSWLEAFSVYCLILSSHFPHHWEDLLQYQLLILQTHHKFAGLVIE